MKAVLDRAALALFRLSLRLLPGWLREHAGAEMQEILKGRLERAPGVAARLRALTLDLGGVLVTAVRSRLPDGHSTERRSFTDALLQDVHFAVRAVARRPLTASLAVLTLGLGIATSTAIYSVVEAVLLRPLPYPDPERVVSVFVTNPSLVGHPTLGGLSERGDFSYPEFADVRDHHGGVLAGVAVLGGGSGILQPADGPAERVTLGVTSASLFGEVLRAEPLLGRTLTDEDERTAFAGVVLGERFWRRRFAGDPAVVGTVVDISGSFEVIGVLPESFAVQGYEADAWTLMPPGTNRDNHGLAVLARLAPGVNPGTAADALTRAFQAAAPEEAGHPRHEIRVFPRHDEETRQVRGPLALLLAASGILLLVACGNVAVLLLGAGLDREQELLVRGALGAQRSRLARQLFTESLLLAAGAALVGAGVARAAVRGLVLLAPPGVPRIDEATVSSGALGFAVAAGFACAVLCGLAPSVVFSRTEGDAAAAGTRGSTRRGRARLQGLVVVGELAMATVLLVGSGLLGRTTRALAAVEMGFAAPELLQVNVAIPFQRLTADLMTTEDRVEVVVEHYERVRQEIGAVPGVAGVTLTSVTPLTGDRGNNTMEIQGWTGEPVVAERRFVSWNFFDVVGTKIVDGRGFQELDDRPDAAGTMIVSRGLAERVWPGESAVGKQLGYWGRTTTVVGVAENVRDEGVRDGTELAYYVPRLQAGQPYGQYLVRTSGDPAALVSAVRERVWALDRSIAIPTLRPLLENRDEAIAAERFRARLVGVFSALAALFALMGIYGVTARSVASRTREMGIRVALGARGRSVLALVLGQGLRLALWGALAGVALSLAVTRFIESYLWGVERTDPGTLVTTALALAGASLIASLAPGLRASRADPLEALRAD